MDLYCECSKVHCTVYEIVGLSRYLCRVRFGALTYYVYGRYELILITPFTPRIKRLSLLPIRGSMYAEKVTPLSVPTDLIAPIVYTGCWQVGGGEKALRHNVEISVPSLQVR